MLRGGAIRAGPALCHSVHRSPRSGLSAVGAGGGGGISPIPPITKAEIRQTSRKREGGKQNNTHTPKKNPTARTHTHTHTHTHQERKRNANAPQPSPPDSFREHQMLICCAELGPAPHSNRRAPSPPSADPPRAALQLRTAPPGPPELPRPAGPRAATAPRTGKPRAALPTCAGGEGGGGERAPFPSRSPPRPTTTTRRGTRRRGLSPPLTCPRPPRAGRGARGPARARRGLPGAYRAGAPPAPRAAPRPARASRPATAPQLPFRRGAPGTPRPRAVTSLPRRRGEGGPELPRAAGGERGTDLPAAPGLRRAPSAPWVPTPSPRSAVLPGAGGGEKFPDPLPPSASRCAPRGAAGACGARPAPAGQVPAGRAPPLGSARRG